MSDPPILVVDDHEDNRQILTAILEHSGYSVLTASLVEDGIRLAQEHAPKLILLDLMMPVLDGWGAIEKLRSDPRTRGIPVMGVTATEEPGLPERLREAGFCAYLRKPFLPLDALDAVERCIAASQAKRAWIDLPAYKVGR